MLAYRRLASPLPPVTAGEDEKSVELTFIGKLQAAAFGTEWLMCARRSAYICIEYLCIHISSELSAKPFQFRLPVKLFLGKSCKSREYSSNLSARNFFFASRTSFQWEYQFIFSRYRVVSSVSRIASRLVCWRLVFSASRRVYCVAGCITFLHQRIEK